MESKLGICNFSSHDRENRFRLWQISVRDFEDVLREYSQIGELPDNRDFGRFAFAAGRILSSSGRLPSARLARETGVGVRQFQREFFARFGASPKLFSRIVRFQTALDTKARSSAKSWTDVAHELGYYDQMHMVHDFKELAGESPTETMGQMELLFRAQIDPVRAGRAAEHPNRVRRFVI